MSTPPFSCRPRRTGAPRPPSAARGTALVVALLMMLLVALLGVSMMRSIGVEARMVGNTGEKQHAFQAAQTALQYGEWWLGQIDNATTGVPCATATATPLVCSNVQSAATLTSVPWTSIGAPYAAPAVNGSSILNVSTGGGAGTYYAAPQLYIAYLGTTGSNQAKLYQVTAVGYGGNANAVAVVQSTFAVSSAVTPLGTGNSYQ